MDSVFIFPLYHFLLESQLRVLILNKLISEFLKNNFQGFQPDNGDQLKINWKKIIFLLLNCLMKLVKGFHLMESFHIQTSQMD